MFNIFPDHKSNFQVRMSNNMSDMISCHFHPKVILKKFSKMSESHSSLMILFLYRGLGK